MHRVMLLALLCAFPLSARADETAKAEGGVPSELFKKLDANSDGQVTATEAGTEKKDLFDRLLRTSDKDGNGSLNQEELVAGLKDDRPELPMDKPTGPGEGRREGRRQGPPDPERMLKRLDKDGDGKIAADEVPEERREFWKRIISRSDKDGDGKLSGDELREGFKAWEARRGERGGAGGPNPGPMIEHMFKHMDKNSDDKVTAEEAAAAGREHFEKVLKAADTDGDKALSKKEFTEGAEKLKQIMMQGRKEGQAGRTHHRRGPRGGKGGGHKPRDPEKVAQKMLERMDTNKDGKLSQEEFSAKAAKRFTKIDSNKDGSIDASELKTHVEAMAARHREHQGKHHGGKHHGEKGKGDRPKEDRAPAPPTPQADPSA